MAYISLLGLILIGLPTAYLVLLALASVRAPAMDILTHGEPQTRFIIAIPAHDEASVIRGTVLEMRKAQYPREFFEVHVVADHCSDATAAEARSAGAVVHVRNEEPRSGKGAALNWLFERIFDIEGWDAVVIFDADTVVDRQFLAVMDAHLRSGEEVIQGKHVIQNPRDGWFPALVWAMFIIDNRFQNLGRTNLGMSAKNMGDSICFRANVLKKSLWGDGLADDYELRLRLLLEGIKIAYQPLAIGYGEAPHSWREAGAQRVRWLKGAREANHEYTGRLLRAGIREMDASKIDGALQALLPSYSTLGLISFVALFLQLAGRSALPGAFPGGLIAAWGFLSLLLLLYPFLGLALERAPLRAYMAILTGPVFIVWRTWLAVTRVIGNRTAVWVRTAHRGRSGR